MSAWRPAPDDYPENNILMARRGIFNGISNSEYHSDKDSYSSSIVKLMDCPAKALHRLQNPAPYADHYRIGTAIHTWVLEPEKFESEFLTGISCARRSKDDKTQWVMWYEENGWAGAWDFVMNNPAEKWNPAFMEATGKNMVAPDEIESLKAMSDSIMRNPNARELLEKGRAENSIYWQDAETGLNLRCRPDFLNDFCSDLKSCDSASRPAVMRSIYNLGYFVSDAMYREGIHSVTGEWLPFLYIFIEKQKPHQCVVYSLDESSQRLAHETYRNNLRKLATALETDNWPGHEDDLELPLPAYAFNE